MIYKEAVMLRYSRQDKDIFEMFGYDKTALRLIINFFNGRSIKFGDKEITVKKVMPLCNGSDKEFCYEIYANKSEKFVVTVNKDLNDKITSGQRTVKVYVENTGSDWYMKEVNIGNEVIYEI